MTKFKYKGRRLLVDGADMTATAAELNANAGVTAGTVAASKALVADANKDLAGLRHFTISGNFVTGSTTLSEAELGVLDGVTAGTSAVSKAMVLDSAGGIGAIWRDTRATGIFKQVTPAAKTTATTLTAAELLTGLLTANQGGAAAANYTLPLATALETALLVTNPGLANDDAFDFTLLNISTVAAEDITVVTNTGWTLVGKMTVESNAAVTDNSFGIFRARRTAANTYTLYRVG